MCCVRGGLAAGCALTRDYRSVSGVCLGCCCVWLLWCIGMYVCASTTGTSNLFSGMRQFTPPKPQKTVYNNSLSPRSCPLVKLLSNAHKFYYRIYRIQRQEESRILYSCWANPHTQKGDRSTSYEGCWTRRTGYNSKHQDWLTEPAPQIKSLY